MVDISLISRVRTRRNYSWKHSKNSKNTTHGRHLLFGEYLRSWITPKCALSKIETRNYFKWIIKQLLNSAFVSYEELWRSRRLLSVEAVTTSSISIILHKILSLDQFSWWKGGRGSVTSKLLSLYFGATCFLEQGGTPRLFFFFSTSKVFTCSNAINAFKQ